MNRNRDDLKNDARIHVKTVTERIIREALFWAHGSMVTSKTAFFIDSATNAIMSDLGHAALFPSHIETICRGSWMLGSACGECSRCLEEAAATIPKLREMVEQYQHKLTNIIGCLPQAAHGFDYSNEFKVRMFNEARYQAVRDYSKDKAKADLSDPNVIGTIDVAGGKIKVKL